MKELDTLCFVYQHVAADVDCGDAPCLVRAPSLVPQYLGHLFLVHVFLELACPYHVKYVVRDRLNAHKDLVVLVGRLAHYRPCLHAYGFAIVDERRRGDDVKAGFLQERCRDFKVEDAHACHEGLAGFFVNLDYKVGVFDGYPAKRLD